MIYNRQVIFLSRKSIIALCFILGLLFSVATSLRVTGSFFGPSEYFLTVGFLLTLVFMTKASTLPQYLLVFWISFFLCLGLGYCMGGYLPRDSFSHNIVSYCGDCFFVCALLVSRINLNKMMYYYSLVQLIFLTMVVLFINKSYYIYGASRFMGLSANPNQLALGLLLCPFILLNTGYHQVKLTRKYLLFISSVLIMFFSLWCASSATVVSYVIILSGIVVFVFYRLILNGQLLKFFLFLLFSCLICIYLIHFQTIINNYFLMRTLNGSESSIRFDLWDQAVDLLKQSPLFGFGPGEFLHISGQSVTFWESHNTFVDIALQAGSIGLLFFLVFCAKIAHGLINNKEYWNALLFGAFLIFICFHFVFREPAFWFYFAYFIWLARCRRGCA